MPANARTRAIPRRLGTPETKTATLENSKVAVKESPFEPDFRSGAMLMTDKHRRQFVAMSTSDC